MNDQFTEGTRDLLVAIYEALDIAAPGVDPVDRQLRNRAADVRGVLGGLLDSSDCTTATAARVLNQAIAEPVSAVSS